MTPGAGAKNDPDEILLRIDAGGLGKEKGGLGGRPLETRTRFD